MQILHYLEVENFKRFADKQRIKLDHPSVLIGPNNCGKTSAIQAIALWSQSVKTWFDVRKKSSAKERTATSINRLAIVSVPVQRTRFFWHDTKVRAGVNDILLSITLGVWWEKEIVPLKINFRNHGDELVYCSPDEHTLNNMEFIKYAASLNVELLYPMSGLATEEPVLQSKYVVGLLGQGQTAQVLRNLCLTVSKNNPEDWDRICQLMKRLFSVELGEPNENAKGLIELYYRQVGVKELLDVSMSGRGFQQMLLIFAYLYSHKGSVLMVDEPDAHLEILRQKQVYVLLRDIASENNSQVILATHSEVILDEALDVNLTLLIEGKTDNLADKRDMKAFLKHYGTDHYIKARERGYVLYVEGSTDLDMLRALAKLLDHPVARMWDERINSYYVQNNYPDQSPESELDRVEGGFGISPKEHFFGLRKLLPTLRGLALRDNDGKGRVDYQERELAISYWVRYEAENYFITPELLERYATSKYKDMELYLPAIREVLDTLTLETIFDGNQEDFETFRKAPKNASLLVWNSKTEHKKLSDFAEEFFRRLSGRINQPMLLRKGELHRLVDGCSVKDIPPEVTKKLDLLKNLFEEAKRHSEETMG